MESNRRAESGTQSREVSVPRSVRAAEWRLDLAAWMYEAGEKFWEASASDGRQLSDRIRPADGNSLLA